MLTVREMPPSRESGVKPNPVVGSNDFCGEDDGGRSRLYPDSIYWWNSRYCGNLAGDSESKRNRDDLRDLCGNTFEIVLLLQAEVSAHGELVAGLRLAGLCEDFVRVLNMLQTGLELLAQNTGLWGLFKDLLRTTSVADQIDRYRNRLNELRSNFLPAFGRACLRHETYSQFRRIALGEINLLYETALTSKVHKVRVFTARISGESSPMTVAKYEDQNEAGDILPST
ncbi:hypothetical protein K438DRAFT_1764905 [Mycena galopus ATCC 62051]|nr:hypothetical protein K438DRAFT_1764905 [Mycena galopus ATCC 62051]